MATATKALLRTARLIMVSEANNNKFYEMKEQDDGTFIVSYGRVGRPPATRQYPAKEWGKKYREKLRKGYTDVTHLFADKPAEIEFDIDDVSVRRLIEDLTRYARTSIDAHYVVAAHDVTAQQIEEAQALLDDLARLLKPGVDVDVFNQQLLALYRVIPRKMKSVQAHLVDTLATTADRTRARELLSDEQETLDVMAGQVKLREQTRTAAEEDRRPTLLEAMGLEITPVEDPERIEQIRTLMRDDGHCLRRVFRVVNRRTQQAFDDYPPRKKRPKTAMLWHGSRNENWLSILESGLVLRPANAYITGKAFGYGLYFADRCRKSLGYTSLHGSYWTRGSQGRAFLALYDVHLGRQLTVRRHQPWCYDLDRDKLTRRGLLGGTTQYDSVFARRGISLLNNEYVVYDEAQCTIRFLIEVGC